MEATGVQRAIINMVRQVITVQASQLVGQTPKAMAGRVRNQKIIADYLNPLATETRLVGNGVNLTVIYNRIWSDSKKKIAIMDSSNGQRPWGVLEPKLELSPGQMRKSLQELQPVIPSTNTKGLESHWRSRW